MTAINSSSFTTSRFTKINLDFTVDVYDFENEVFTYEVRAHSEEEAGQKAAEIAQCEGHDVSYTCAYRY